MRRHQPREAGPDTRNTGPRGREPLPGAFHSSQAGEPRVPSPGAPPSRTARWKIRRSVTPQVQGCLERREAHGGHAPRAVAHEIGRAHV